MGDHHHIVETLSFERLVEYVKFSPSSRWAAVDAIVCKADTDLEGIATYTLPRALKLAADFRGFPEHCAMRDGRKWKTARTVARLTLDQHIDLVRIYRVSSFTQLGSLVAHLPIT